MLPSFIRRFEGNFPQRVVLIALAASAGCAAYLLTAQPGRYGIGFPLDDAWIYQVYARNLAASGQWAFVLGTPSTGSTSVLWTLLITPAYTLGIDGRLWTLILGIVALISLAYAASNLIPESRPIIRLGTALGVALEWHLVWSAVSGMETVLFAGMILWFWGWLNRHVPMAAQRSGRFGLMLGLWGGALTLARPEGILAYAVGAIYALISMKGWGSRARYSIASGIGLALLIVPLLTFNYLTSGTVWPNTFAAKQAEYSILLTQPYLERLLQQVGGEGGVFVGPQLLLIPGLVAVVWNSLRRGAYHREALVPIIWAGLHLALYAARLPVTYQHARYAIPAIPVVVVYGIYGMSQIARARSRSLVVRDGVLVWMAATIALFPAVMVVFGAPAYAHDVRFIETEMVAAAHWIDGHTAPTAVIAVHDIGALGYFAPRRIVDLAGLVSPDVIEFINDDYRLANFILEKNSDYLVVFPDWSPAYEKLVARTPFCKVWSADQDSGYVAFPGQAAMTIYRVARNGQCFSQPGLSP